MIGVWLLYLAAVAFALAWYRRYSEREARRVWRAYFSWIRGKLR